MQGFFIRAGRVDERLSELRIHDTVRGERDGGVGLENLSIEMESSHLFILPTLPLQHQHTYIHAPEQRTSFIIIITSQPATSTPASVFHSSKYVRSQYHIKIRVEKQPTTFPTPSTKYQAPSTFLLNPIVRFDSGAKLVFNISRLPPSEISPFFSMFFSSRWEED